MAFLCDLVNWTEGWSLGKRKGIEAEDGSNAETASREDGRPAGWYFWNVFRLQYDSKYFIFNKVWVTHLYFFYSLSWLKFEIIEYNMNLLDLILDKCTLTWWWMCRTQQNDVFVYLLEFSFLSE